MIGSPLPGVRLLTRVPLPTASPDDAARLGASVTFFPLIGLLIGAILAGLCLAAVWPGRRDRELRSRRPHEIGLR